MTNYRGPLVIIASKTPNRKFATHYPDLPQPTSCLMAVVDLVDIVGEKGDYQWQLRNPRPLEQTHYTRSRVTTCELEPDVVIHEASASDPTAPTKAQATETPASAP